MEYAPILRGAVCMKCTVEYNLVCCFDACGVAPSVTPMPIKQIFAEIVESIKSLRASIAS